MKKLQIKKNTLTRENNHDMSCSVFHPTASENPKELNGLKRDLLTFVVSAVAAVSL